MCAERNLPVKDGACTARSGMKGPGRDQPPPPSPFFSDLPQVTRLQPFSQQLVAKFGLTNGIIKVAGEVRRSDHNILI